MRLPDKFGPGHGGAEGRASRDRWLITYADLITLLLIFFVVMYAISKVDADKFAAIAQALTKALGGSGMVLPHPGASVSPGVGQPQSAVTPGASEGLELARVRTQLEEVLREKGLNAYFSVRQEERGIVLSIQDTVLFDLGKADLRPEAKKIIDDVGLVLLQTPNYIRIEGHTDNLPIHTPQFPSNWELSVARACSVVQRLIHTLNFPPERLSATGYGEYRPRVPNDTPEHRQLNRRVDFVILSSRYRNVEPQPLAPPPGIPQLQAR
ncbi:MAG: flagellar motor protein MotB [Bacillota bacterium]